MLAVFALPSPLSATHLIASHICLYYQIDALRRTFSHQESRRNQLREENALFATEFERVIREIDALSNELREISEHAVQLDANFSKYGYSAHLRTKDGPDESLHSSSESTFDKETWQAERKLGETMRFFQRPIVRQYFHKGLLWRAKEAQEVASYELFIDLFYVGIISITGDSAAESPTGGVAAPLLHHLYYGLEILERHWHDDLLVRRR